MAHFTFLETTARDFETSSYMDWKLKDAFMTMLNTRSTTVSFSYRTRDTDGLLFSVVDRFQSSKYIKVKVSSLIVNYDFIDLFCHNFFVGNGIFKGEHSQLKSDNTK